jgi:aspartyl-tRNA synthetase
MNMTGADSIRDVIAFPNTEGSCLMTDAPSRSHRTMMELSLKIVLTLTPSS